MLRIKISQLFSAGNVIYIYIYGRERSTLQGKGIPYNTQPLMLGTHTQKAALCKLYSTIPIILLTPTLEISEKESCLRS